MATWQLMLCAVAFVVGAVGLALAGFFTTRALVKRHISTGHHQVAGNIFLTAVGFYSILLGFVAVIVWQRFDATDQDVTEEAAALIGVFRDTQAFPEPYRSEAERALRDYAAVGIPSEWTSGGNAHIRPHTTPDLLNPVWRVYREMQARAGSGAIYLDAVKRLRSLEQRRHLRHLASQQTLPPVFWWVLVAGAVLTALTSYTNYIDNLGMHAALTALAATLVGMIFFLIWALDAPFTGPVRLSEGAFQHALQQFNAITLPAQDGMTLSEQIDGRGRGERGARPMAPVI